jgi:FHS family L-fucose permease-like MFS transporter
MIAVGLCNSIMFPTIFTLALKGLEKSAEKASGLLATSILGGAIIPLFTGWMADTSGLRTAFILPAVCYAYIAFYGFKLRK